MVIKVHVCSLKQPSWFLCGRDDDSDDELDDRDIHKIMIVTQTPPPLKKHDRTGNYMKRAKITAEFAKVINDGLFYYEQVRLADVTEQMLEFMLMYI